MFSTVQKGVVFGIFFLTSTIASANCVESNLITLRSGQKLILKFQFNQTPTANNLPINFVNLTSGASFSWPVGSYANISLFDGMFLLHSRTSNSHSSAYSQNSAVVGIPIDFSNFVNGTVCGTWEFEPIFVNGTGGQSEIVEIIVPNVATGHAIPGQSAMVGPDAEIVSCRIQPVDEIKFTGFEGGDMPGTCGRSSR